MVLQEPEHGSLRIRAHLSWNRNTSPCSPCAPNLLHMLVSRILGYHNLCSPGSYRWQGDRNHGHTKHSFFLDYHTIPIVKSQLHKKLFNGRRSNYSALICTAVCSASVSGLQIMQKVE